jgi:hypothetical protein
MIVPFADHIGAVGRVNVSQGVQGTAISRLELVFWPCERVWSAFAKLGYSCFYLLSRMPRRGGALSAAGVGERSGRSVKAPAPVVRRRMSHDCLECLLAVARWSLTRIALRHVLRFDAACPSFPSDHAKAPRIADPAYAAAKSIRNSSICLPDSSCAVSHCGCFPRPAHVCDGRVGLRYFGKTGG